MPRGSCQVCGCTLENPCLGGCEWANQELTHCSHCVNWGVLDPRLVEAWGLGGVFPYGLVPLLGTQAFAFRGPGPMGRLGLLGLPIDLRRLDEETVLRLVFLVAPTNDGTVEEFLEQLEQKTGGMMVPPQAFVCTIGALSLEDAAACKDRALREAALAKRGLARG